MKLSQARLREIIQEEVARMNEDERSPEKRVFDYVVKNYITDKESDKTDAANIIIQKIRREKDLSGSLGPDTLLRQVRKTMIETFPKEKLPRSWRPKEELEEVDNAGLEALAAIGGDKELRNMTAKEADATQLVSDLQKALQDSDSTTEERAYMIDQAIKDYKS